MKKNKPPYDFCVIAVLLVCCFFYFGCVHTTDPYPVVQGLPKAKNATENTVEVSRENLSMAKELNQVPAPEYLLGPEDSVKISVFRHDEFNVEAKLDPTGKISGHLIGDINAGGLTQFQLRDKIQKEYSKFIREPKVVVTISEYRSHKVYVLGQVKNPGIYRMRSNFTLLESIAAAGGITNTAYLEGAYVVRDGKMLVVNFYELIKKGKTNENIIMYPEDMIFIPDNKDQRVFVLGEVNSQKALYLRDGMTLVEAIVEAGGFTNDAEKESVLMMRGNLSEPQVWKINTERIDLAMNIPLTRGDIVYVPSSTFADVERTAVRLYNILQPFYNLSRTVVWGDGASGILFRGDESRYVLPD